MSYRITIRHNRRRIAVINIVRSRRTSSDSALRSIRSRNNVWRFGIRRCLRFWLRPVVLTRHLPSSFSSKNINLSSQYRFIRTSIPQWFSSTFTLYDSRLISSPSDALSNTLVPKFIRWVFPRFSFPITQPWLPSTNTNVPKSFLGILSRFPITSLLLKNITLKNSFHFPSIYHLCFLSPPFLCEYPRNL